MYNVDSFTQSHSTMQIWELHKGRKFKKIFNVIKQKTVTIVFWFEHMLQHLCSVNYVLSAALLRGVEALKDDSINHVNDLV